MTNAKNSSIMDATFRNSLPKYAPKKTEEEIKDAENRNLAVSGIIRSIEENIEADLSERRKLNKVR